MNAKKVETAMKKLRMKPNRGGSLSNLSYDQTFSRLLYEWLREHTTYLKAAEGLTVEERKFFYWHVVRNWAPQRLARFGKANYMLLFHRVMREFGHQLPIVNAEDTSQKLPKRQQWNLDWSWDILSR